LDIYSDAIPELRPRQAQTDKQRTDRAFGWSRKKGAGSGSAGLLGLRKSGSVAKADLREGAVFAGLKPGPSANYTKAEVG
jgi:hypothetical protein